MISRFTVEHYVLEIAEYYRTRTKVDSAKSIAECNSYFKNTDGYLRVILSRIKSLISQKRIPEFSTKFPNINVTPRGMLGKKCCNCLIDPVPYGAKNNIRKLGEKYINEWSFSAQAYLGGNQSRADIGAKVRKKIKSKKTF